VGRLVLGVALATGCGRVAFEPIPHGAGVDAGTGDVALTDGGSPLLAHALGASGNPISDTPPIDTTGAVALVACVTTYYISVSTANLTDNYGNAWVRVSSTASVNSNNLDLYVATSPITGPAHVFEGSGGDGYATVGVLAFGAPAVVLDKAAQNAGTGTSMVQAGMITPSEAGELVVSCIGANSHTDWTGITVTDGLTVVEQQLVGTTTSPEELGVAWTIRPDAQALNPTWTVTGSDIAINAVAASFRHP
jgi:hypothetical protein